MSPSRRDTSFGPVARRGTARVQRNSFERWTQVDDSDDRMDGSSRPPNYLSADPYYRDNISSSILGVSNGGFDTTNIQRSVDEHGVDSNLLLHDPASGRYGLGRTSTSLPLRTYIFEHISRDYHDTAIPALTEQAIAAHDDYAAMHTYHGSLDHWILSQQRRNRDGLDSSIVGANGFRYRDSDATVASSWTIAQPVPSLNSDRRYTDQAVCAAGLQFENVPATIRTDLEIAEDDTSDYKTQAVNTTVSTEENETAVQTSLSLPAQEELLCQLLRGYVTYRQDRSTGTADAESDYALDSTDPLFRHIACLAYQSRGNDDAADKINTKHPPTASAPASSSLGGSKRKTSDEKTASDEAVSCKPRKKTKTESKARHKALACPFWKLDSEKYRACCKLVHNRIRDVKQHLRRRHTPEWYCPRCFSIFDDFETHDAHVASVIPCHRVAGTRLDGISVAQDRTLGKQSDRRLDEEGQWFVIWDTVFPDQRRPVSAYVDHDLSEELSSFREYWTRQGSDILVEAMRSSTMLSLSVEQREVQLRLVLERGLETIYDAWASTRHMRRISNPDSSSPVTPEELSAREGNDTSQSPQPQGAAAGNPGQRADHTGVFKYPEMNEDSENTAALDGITASVDFNFWDDSGAPLDWLQRESSEPVAAETLGHVNPFETSLDCHYGDKQLNGATASKSCPYHDPPVKDYGHL